uniref:Putative lipocalin-2 1 n=1 Tax=Ixodes ricinus TaxID=34613 RepID=V5IBV3_IXORI
MFTDLTVMKAKVHSVSICILVLLTQHVMAYPEIRIDDDRNYEQYQDINQALQNSDSLSWMYRRTYKPEPNDPEYACVYANVTRLPGEGLYVFLQGWTKVDNTTIEVPLLVNTTKTPGYGYLRKRDNAMHVTLDIPKLGLHKDFGIYKLIYSDNKECDILRVTSKAKWFRL